MEEILKTIMTKLSSYNIFNYLFPGALFCLLSKYCIIGYDLFNSSWIENIIICYFVGMVLSRIGSLLVEPILKSISYKNKRTNQKVRLLNCATYSDFKKAREQDNTIDVFSEVNNMYRTLIATFFVLIVLKIFISLFGGQNFQTIINCSDTVLYILFLALIILFVFSYAKQTKYIAESVKHILNYERQL